MRLPTQTATLNGNDYRVTVEIERVTAGPPPPPPPPPASGYTVKAGEIYDAGEKTQFRGMNHHGFNAWDVLRPTMLWDMAWKPQITIMRDDIGANAIRLPIVPDTLYSTRKMGEKGFSFLKLPENQDLVGKTPLQVLDLWMEEADRQGMYIVIDIHSVSGRNLYFHPYVTDPNDYGAGQWIETWNRQPYTKDHWLRDLAFVADRYKTLRKFAAVDIFNEPHDRIRWMPTADPLIAGWKPLAEAASKVILAANPKLLVFVEGIGPNWDGREDPKMPINWGESFQPQAYLPLDIPADKLVLSPHSYGPDVSYEPEFDAPYYPHNLAKNWEILFGKFHPQFTVIPGEWGGRYGQGGIGRKDVEWQDAFVDYMRSKKMTSSFYWALLNSQDTGDMFDAQGKLRPDKVALLNKHWSV